MTASGKQDENKQGSQEGGGGDGMHLLVSK